MDLPDGIVLGQVAPADVPLMRRVNALFGDAFEDLERYGAQPPSEAHLRRLLGSETFVALAATLDGKVVGALAAYELVKFERETSEFYLYDLAVGEPYRRRGIATALIDRLRTVAARRGAEVVFVQADRGDGPAIALYESLGTREDVHHFDIATRLGGPER